MPKNDNGYSFQPELMNKIYDDRKEEKKKAEKEAKEIKKKKETKEKLLKREKEREKRKIERKKRKKKKTFKDKMVESALAIVVIPLTVLFLIYVSSSYLDILLSSTPGSKFLKEFFPDNDGKPYGKGEQGDGIKCSEIKKFLPKRETIEGVEPVNKGKDNLVGGGKNKKYKQKGGFNSAVNEKKPFLDSTKYGPPYSWVENDNFFMNGMGNYFKTFWQGLRGLIKKILVSLNETLYKDYSVPNGLGEKVIDYLKFTVALPLSALITFTIIPIASIGLLFWSAINNQTFLIIPLLIFAILSIFLGWLAPPPFQYFWPWGLITLYSIVFVLKTTTNKLSYFTEYSSRYKWIWCLTIAFGWFISLGKIWNWSTESNVFSGMIVALLFSGMLGLTNLV